MIPLDLHRSFVVRVMLFVVAFLITPGTFAQNIDPQLQRQLDQVRQAMLVLEAGDAEAAKKLLEPLLTQTPPNSLLRHTAALVHGQLTGSFAPRMAAWADRKVVNTVVLVPDEASLLAAIAQWPADRFWPVLIEDGWFAPLFVEAFEPATVVRWHPRKGGGDEAERANMPGQVAATIKRHNEHFTDAKDSATAPGLVVIDPWSPMRVAGVALALGRQQAVMALKPEGNHSRMASHQQVRKLQATVMNALKSLKLVSDENWCAVTLAGDWPYKFDEDGGKYNPLCVDDYIGRDDRLIRQAVVGRLFGDATQANYMAMCSLFLQPERGLLVNSYTYNEKPAADDGYSRYHLNHAAVTLNQRFEVKLINRGAEQSTQFRSMTQPSMPFGFLWINSAFGTHTLAMSPEGLVSDDMPLGRPMAVHMVASFSATDPWDATTIAGHCLAGGAYYYFGSVHEPYLQSFMQSTAMAHRAVGNGTPLAFASRQPAVYPFARPWKLITLGDPLFTFRAEPAERIGGEPIAGAVAVTVAEEGETNPGQRLINAALSRSSSTLALAEAAIAEPLRMPADTLAYAALTLARAGRNDLLVELSSQAVTRHPATEVIFGRAVTSEIRRHTEAGRLDEAQTLVGRLLAMHLDAGRRDRLIAPWMAAMEKAGRGDEAERWVSRFSGAK